MKFIEKIYIFLWKYMEGENFMYKINLLFIFYILGSFSWLISLTIIQKIETLVRYSSYIGYSIGGVLFILLSFLYHKWTKRVIRKYNLDSLKNFKTKNKYLKFALVIIGSLLLFFFMFWFFARVVKIDPI
jgi:ABC-type multidrug transport system fused ATPase/permease subunit